MIIPQFYLVTVTFPVEIHNSDCAFFSQKHRKRKRRIVKQKFVFIVNKTNSLDTLLFFIFREEVLSIVTKTPTLYERGKPIYYKLCLISAPSNIHAFNILEPLQSCDWENERQISQNYILHMKFSEFYLFFHVQFLWNLKFIFSDSHEKSSLVLLQMTNYIFKLALGKCKKECNILYLSYFGTRFLSTEN